jgi:hypothetical protein
MSSPFVPFGLVLVRSTFERATLECSHEAGINDPNVFFQPTDYEFNVGERMPCGIESIEIEQDAPYLGNIWIKCSPDAAPWRLSRLFSAIEEVAASTASPNPLLTPQFPNDPVDYGGFLMVPSEDELYILVRASSRPDNIK